MTRMMKNDPFASDDEDEIIVPVTKAESQDDALPDHFQKHYLYVPYKFKDEARMCGAKFDKTCKKWYCHIDTKLPIKEQTKNVIHLVDTFHEGNFEYGTRMKKSLISYKRYLKDEKDKRTRLEDVWTKLYGDDGFNKWFDNKQEAAVAEGSLNL